jgi:histidinol-phosphate aminotransferase
VLSGVPQPRAHVTARPRYVAGRPPAAGPGPTTFKLSSNENPYPPLPGVVQAAAAALEQMNRYPDFGSTVLVETLAAAWAVPVADLAVATGSSGLIYDLLRAYAGPGDEIVYPWLSFEAYPIAVLGSEATGVPVPLRADGTHDLDAMAAAITPRTRIVLLCSPNNPTGPALTQAEVDAFLLRVPSDVVVMLDQAYVEFVRLPGAVDGLATYRAHQNVVLMRTFSKAYGLAGLRVGYAIAPAPIAAALRATAIPFPVSLIAQAAAVASLGLGAELADRVETLVSERDRVLDGVRSAGWEVPDAQGNFLWLPGADADALLAAAEEIGITVRPLGTAEQRGVRISLGEPEANDRIIELAHKMRR